MSASDGSDQMRPIIEQLASGGWLTPMEAERAFEAIMNGQASHAQMGAFLMGLRVRGETVSEITAGAKVLRAKAVRVDAPHGVIDTCGTGGDAKGTYNISTAVAIVLAGAGAKVAKHGNRKASSQSGAADVLEYLGVRLHVAPETVTQAIEQAGIGFLMAPLHHSAMTHVAAVRKDLGVRTVFNLLGPLSNPAGAKRQLLGVYDSRWLTPFAEVLRNLGSDRVWVVHGMDGLDELTITGPSRVAALQNGSIETFEIVPEDAGLLRAPLDAIKGGDPAHNAEALNALLNGEPGAYRDVVVLNAAAGLIVADIVSDLKDGAELAAEVIDSGRARAALGRLKDITNRPMSGPSAS